MDSIVSMVSLHIKSINTHEKHWISISNPLVTHMHTVTAHAEFTRKIADSMVIQWYRTWTYADQIERLGKGVEWSGMEWLLAHTLTLTINHVWIPNIFSKFCQKNPFQFKWQQKSKMWFKINSIAQMLLLLLFVLLTQGSRSLVVRMTWVW